MYRVTRLSSVPKDPVLFRFSFLWSFLMGEVWLGRSFSSFWHNLYHQPNFQYRIDSEVNVTRSNLK